MCVCVCLGTYTYIHTYMHTYIKYVTLFLANFDPSSPCHTLSHIPGPAKLRHTSRTAPRFLVRLVQRNRTKAPCTNSLSIVRGGFCQRVFCLESFVRGGVCPIPLLS